MTRKQLVPRILTNTRVEAFYTNNNIYSPTQCGLQLMVSDINRAPFLLLSAFTSNPDSGNPAAVVFLPSPGTSFSTEKLQAIAKNLNQPITNFVSPLPEPRADEPRDIGPQADFAIRWFTVEQEVPLCGHGTLATAKAIFATPDVADEVVAKSGSNWKMDGNEGLLRFQTITGAIVTARQSTLTQPGSESEVELIQITFPHAPPVPIGPTTPTAAKVRSALAKSLQKPAGEVDIRYMGHGGGSMDFYLLVELGETETLKGREIAGDALVRDLTSLFSIIGDRVFYYTFIGE
jgi:hypothetical protein